MSKKIVKLQATYIYEIEIDTESSNVKDYDLENDMFNHIVDCRFSEVLPVMKDGIVVKDVETGSWEKINLKK